MLILAADTSGKNGSLALARGHHDGACAVLDVVPLAGGTFSAQLVPQIAALLGKHRFTKVDIAALAVASGPGSFTGLRVGLAAIKALAEILSKPIAAVSLLEALALAGDLQGNVAQGKVVALLDAGRGEAYLGEYEIAGDSARLLRERILPTSGLTQLPAASTFVTSDPALAEAARSAGSTVREVAPISAAAVARLGWRKIQRGETVTPEQLEANYIRRSDAEIFAVNKP